MKRMGRVLRFEEEWAAEGGPRGDHTVNHSRRDANLVRAVKRLKRRQQLEGERRLKADLRG